MDYLKRIKKLQTVLKKRRLDALLVSQPENRRYLSGYTDGDHGITETSGVLLVPAKGISYFLTDFRYKIQAEQEVQHAEIVLYPKGLLALLKKLLPDLGIKTLGFESHYILHSTFLQLEAMAKKAKITLAAKNNIVEKMRIIKDEEEIRTLKKSVRLNEQIFREVYEAITPEMSELDVALMIELLMKKKGASGPSFESIVTTGKNSALPHAVPANIKIRKNAPLTIDMGLILDGYCSDMTRSFCIGKTSKKYKKIHRIVRKAQVAAMETVKAGVRTNEVDKVARNIIADAGYGKQFGHALGHGVGLAVHEDPRVSSMSKQKLKEGMVITIEPGIYLPGWGGVRLENMVVVRKNGCENLNDDTTELDI